MTTKKRGLSKGLESLLGANMSKTMAPTTRPAESAPSSVTPTASATSNVIEKQNQSTPESPSSARSKPKVSAETRAKRAHSEPFVSFSRELDMNDLGEDISKATSADAPVKTTKETASVVTYKLIGQLKPGRYQPRRSISDEELESLASSIKLQGLLQPIVVRAVKKGVYEILAGERRWRACQKAGLAEVPVIVKDVTDKDALAIGIIENIQRENLNPLDEAKALERLCKEFELSHQQVATLVGKSRTVVTNLLRILNLMPDVKTMLERGEIDVGHAKVLLALEGLSQVEAAKIVVSKQLSVRETEALVASGLGGGADKTEDKKEPKVDPDIRMLQNTLTDKLGAPVKIAYNTKGAGRLEIRYSSLDELDGILEHILN